MLSGMPVEMLNRMLSRMLDGISCRMPSRMLNEILDEILDGMPDEMLSEMDPPTSLANASFISEIWYIRGTPP